MRRSLDGLWDRLLHEGVARRHARRYVAELRDHLDDLIVEEGQWPNGSLEAESRALARLGDVDLLAGAMIERREFRAWSAKAPLATYLIAPALTLAVSTALVMSAVVVTCAWLKGGGGAPSDLPLWSRALAVCAVFFSNAVIAVLLGWALGGMAILQRSSPALPVFGIAILACLGAVIQLGVTLPSANTPGEIEFLSSFGPSFAQWLKLVDHLVLNLALTLTPYVGLCLWRTARANLNHQDLQQA